MFGSYGSQTDEYGHFSQEQVHLQVICYSIVQIIDLVVDYGGSNILVFFLFLFLFHFFE